MRIPVQTAKKMVSAVERGESVAAVARRFEVTERGLHKFLRRYCERGTLDGLVAAAGDAFQAVTDDECHRRF